MKAAARLEKIVLEKKPSSTSSPLSQEDGEMKRLLVQWKYDQNVSQQHDTSSANLNHQSDPDLIQKPSSYQHQIVDRLEEMMGKNRRLPLVDIEDDFDDCPPQNTETVFQNVCYHHPLDLLVMWLMFCSLWGVQVLVYNNIYSIYYALQGDSFHFTVQRNAVFVSLFGVGNAAGRALAGFCVPIVQSRAQAVWSLMRISPALNVMGLLLFLVCRGAALCVPFVVVGIATGFTWGSTILCVKKIFTLPGQHYAFTFSAGAVGIACFCVGLFATVYESHGVKSEQDGRIHCIGSQCVNLSFGVAIVLNVFAVLSAHWIVKRIDLGELDTTLATRKNVTKQSVEHATNGGVPTSSTNDVVVQANENTNDDDDDDDDGGIDAYSRGIGGTSSSSDSPPRGKAAQFSPVESEVRNFTKKFSPSA